MVPTEPHPSQSCAGRSTMWRISTSATEMELSTHYSHDSAPATVLRVLKIITSQLSDPDTVLNRQLPPMQIKVRGAEIRGRGEEVRVRGKEVKASTTQIRVSNGQASVRFTKVDDSTARYESRVETSTSCHQHRKWPVSLISSLKASGCCIASAPNS